MSLWNKIKYLNLNMFRTRCCKPMIFQTQIIWSNRIHSLKYLRSTTLICRDKGIKKSEFVTMTQFLYIILTWFNLCFLIILSSRINVAITPKPSLICCFLLIALNSQYILIQIVYRPLITCISPLKWPKFIYLNMPH